MTYAYEFNIFQKTHPCRSTKLVSFKESLTSYITPHFNLAMNAKTTTTPTCFTLLFCQTEKMSGKLGKLGSWCRPGSRVPVTILMWLHLTELRSKNQTKTRKKTRHQHIQHPLNLELIRSISSTATLLHHTSPTSTPRTFCVSNNVTRRQRWAALVSFRPLFKVSWDVNPKNTGSIQHLSIGLLIGRTECQCFGCHDVPTAQCHNTFRLSVYMQSLACVQEG